MTEVGAVENQVQSGQHDQERNQLQAVQIVQESQDIDVQIQNDQFTEEKLEVDVYPKENIQNPQNTFTVIENEFQSDTSLYGPFSHVDVKPRIQFKKVIENINYQIDISPVLSNLQSKTISDKTNKFRNRREKKSSSILTEQSNHEVTNKVDKAQLQREILALAKNIRQRVKNKEKLKDSRQQNSPLAVGLVKIVEGKETEFRLRQIYLKRQSLFEKYSYPRTIGVDLNQLQRQEQRLKAINDKYQLEEVHQQQQQLQPQSIIKAQAASYIPQNTNSIINKSHSHTNEPSPKPQKGQVQLPRLKLNFDKTHHKYQMTQFRKSILSEKKDREMAKSLLMKEKENALKKRRDIYNTSRYHPVGIKLSSLKTSRTPGQQVQHVLVAYKNDRTQNATENTKQQAVPKQNCNETQVNIQTPTFINDQKTFPQLSTANRSQVKSSLTFNFSFSDPIIAQSELKIIAQSELKSESQIIQEVSKLTKQLDNDSNAQWRKDQFIQQGQNTMMSKENPAKKWESLGQNTDKGMTQSKQFEEVGRLHNSSASQHDLQEDYNNTDLQYSYI